MQNGLPGFDADAASDAGQSERVRDVRAVLAAYPQPAPAGGRSPRKCPRPCTVRLREARGVARARRGDDGGALRLENCLLEPHLAQIEAEKRAAKINREFASHF